MNSSELSSKKFPEDALRRTREYMALYGGARVVFEKTEPTLSDINLKLESILSSAPILIPEKLSRRVNLMENETNDNIFSLKIPEDIHLLKLFEKVIFEKLLQMANSLNSKEAIVPQEYIMLFDSYLPKLFVKASAGLIIRGETILDHELAHALAANNEGIDQAFISISFYWLKIKNKKN